MAMPRRRPLLDPKQYYAYVWRLDGEVIWVGQGKDNRARPTCKASWSGRPKELLTILEVRRHEIEWNVLACVSKATSVEVEKRLIKKYKPRFNTAPQQGGWKGMHSQSGLNNIRRSARERVYSPEECKARSLRMMGNTLRKGMTNALRIS